MINLLPEIDYRELHAARQNVLLVRLLASAVICLLGTVFAISAAYVLIGVQERDAKEAKQSSEKQLSQYQKVEAETKDFKNNLSTAKQILDKNISYRTMLINIAQALPQNAIIANLQLSPDIIGKPTTLTISTTSYEQAVAIKDSLNHSKIAQDVSLGGVTTATNQSNTTSNETNAIDNQFPVTAQMNLTFTKGLLTPTWESSTTENTDA